MEDLHSQDRPISEVRSGDAEPISFLQRVILVFTEPAQAFANIAAHPAWIGAFLLVLLAGLVSTQATFPYLMEAQEQAFQQSPNMTAEQTEMMLQRFNPERETTQRIQMSLLAVVFGFLELIVLAGLFTFGCSFLLGGEATFKQVMAVVAYSLLVRVPRVLLLTPLILLKKSMSVSSSLAVLIPMDQWMTPLGVLLMQVDFFKIWGIVLLITGLATLYRFSKGKVAVLVVGFFSLWVVIQVVLAIVASSIMGNLTGG
ncbi:Yip1 family protein [Candidatus Zixiibacteriota bacterium]